MEAMLETWALTLTPGTFGRSLNICEPHRGEMEAVPRSRITTETKMLCTSEWPLLNTFLLLSLNVESNLPREM